MDVTTPHNEATVLNNMSPPLYIGPGDWTPRTSVHGQIMLFSVSYHIAHQDSS